MYFAGGTVCLRDHYVRTTMPEWKSGVGGVEVGHAAQGSPEPFVASTPREMEKSLEVPRWQMEEARILVQLETFLVSQEGAQGASNRRNSLITIVICVEEGSSCSIAAQANLSTCCSREGVTESSGPSEQIASQLWVLWLRHGTRESSQQLWMRGGQHQRRGMAIGHLLPHLTPPHCLRGPLQAVNSQPAWRSKVVEVNQWITTYQVYLRVRSSS